MADVDAETATGGAKLSLSCLQCRSRKVRCDKTKPGCNRCTASAVDCTYPGARKKPVIVATRPRVKELEARLKHLEKRLGDETAASAPSPPNSTSPPSSASPEALVTTGRFEQLPPQAVAEELVEVFFARVYREVPLLHPLRYRSSLYFPSHMQPPMCLQYAVLAVAALASPMHIHLAEAFYRRARHYAESDELKGDGQDFITVAHAQCWALITRFEALSMWFTRANMSCARSVRLAQMLGLDKIDGKAASSQPLPPARDWVETEERRRTFWVVFSSDRSSSGTTEWPVLINWRTVHTRLPASEAAFQAGLEEMTPTIQAARRDGMTFVSTFAWRILVIQLFQESAELSAVSYLDGESDDSDFTVFWSRYLNLDKLLITAATNLPDSLQCQENANDADAVFVNCVLQTSFICLHKAGRSQLKNSQIPNMPLPTQEQVMPAAHAIFSILAGLADIDMLFRSPFVAFASYMAAVTLLEDFGTTQNPESDERLGILMDLMIAIGDHNPYTASLVIQLAHVLYKTGTDQSALGKVSHLFAKLDIGDGSLLAQEDSNTGGVIFCPLEHQKGPFAAQVTRFWSDG
jgi:hypothetical protein